MLDISHEKSVIEDLWQAADARTELPLDTAQFSFDLKGSMPSQFGSRQSFHRYYLRGAAILIQGDRIYGVYTTDLSRQGIGFLAPRQLLPKEKWTQTLPNGVAYELRIKWCRRETNSCFACGGRFTT